MEQEQQNLDRGAEAAPVVLELEARETNWEIAAVHTVRGYGFNGQVPGPTIEASSDDTVLFRLKNGLPEPTSIHWHGLRVPAAMDGANAVRPGETFEYRFRLPDAGTFWYHPHVNEMEQLERGLYGAIIVRGPGEPTLDGERVLMLDDLRLNRRGRFARFGGLMERMRGREGTTRLVNGRVEPEITIAAGQIERWRLVNAASARYVRLSIGGVPFRILGTDGGLLGAPITATEVLLAPGDRAELAVGPFGEGETFSIESLPYNRGAGGKRKAERFATLHVGAPASSRANIPAILRPVEPLVVGPVEPNRIVRLGGRLSLRHGVEGLVNDEPHHQDEPVRVGELQLWDVVNETPADHPFHLHGFFFQVLKENETISWEDTANVPAKGQIRIAWLPDDRPGSWMYHCHILEHHAAGMMAHFDVVA